ncbi:MAG: homocitrate synthase [Oscillospiraceae bacterium]|jgi:homocitrate synthase NifV|nr:homocitrate synthase [Oscillospiraceae bacterium]
MKEQRYIVDTTLRDGEQTAGVAFSLAEKVRTALLLDRAGIYQIESGAPMIGKIEKDTICKIIENRVNSKISTWNRIAESDIRHSLDCCPDIIHISAPVSYPHIYSKLKKNKEWLRNRLRECAGFALEMGYEVTIGYEDASRADMSFVISLTEMLGALGVSTVRIADTVGVLTPSRTTEMIREVHNAADVRIEFHAHNDLGCAAANSIAAARAGAAFIDTTLFGLGERAGNCDMRTFIKSAAQMYDIRPSLADAETLENELITLNR